ncbi:hypothetical protein SAMN04487820_102247 [Actinopolyspora mzabensis]|uniref:Trypsin-like peptidase domain-containing protein n=1 Tax=Actinopolyspora mzabensis TaxID=995066 RepID=A0A1G8WW85_ACTMZ|nr:hypothetical protein [Actinopolyspora mzabensis]SDJ82336.1 hypothetical protein SAMN04487820_102247 [Actinopolyspora mzabensis]
MISVREARDRAAIRPIKRAVEDQLLDLPGVGLVDIGEKWTSGRPTGQQVIIVSVARKKPMEWLEVGECVPSLILGIPTDVVEERVFPQHAHCSLDELVPAVLPTPALTVFGGVGIAPSRPVVLGPVGSVAEGQHRDGGQYRRIGTLGALVTGRGSAVLTMGLTTFDVACMDDAWSVGDAMLDPHSGRCYAELSRAALSGRVDAAAVMIDEAFDCCRTIPGVGAVTGQGVAEVGDTVRKSGLGTGLTRGSVASTDATLRIDHGDALGVRTRREQLRVVTTREKPFTGAGDAGAVVVDGEGGVVGLHTAGSADGRTGFACPIADVLAELDVKLAVTFRRLRPHDQQTR